MFPSALAIPAPIPFALDLTLEFGPLLLLVLLALLDLGAVAVLHDALVSRRRDPLREDLPVRRAPTPVRLVRHDGGQECPPSTAT